MLKHFLTKKQNGFTLLEMLVVIGIIGILVGIGAASYSTVQKKARDAKRKDDLKVIQQSMEQYYSVCNYTYPTSVTDGIICASVTPTIALLPTVPVDPRTTTPYPFPTLDATSYQVCTTLESESVTNYCVTNQQ